MAIRVLKGKKSPYQVYWNNPFTGRRESASFQTEIEAKKHDALVKYQLKYERERFKPVEEITTPSSQQCHTLESAYYLYLKDRRFQIDALRRSVSSMKQILEGIGQLQISEIGAEQIGLLKNRMLETGIKATSFKRRMASLKAVLRWCSQAGLLEHTPRFPSLPAMDYERHVPPTGEELSALLLIAAPHIQRVIILGTQFGMRVGPSEMFRVEWSDVDLPGRVVRVPAAKKNRNEPWREVPIREHLVPVFAEWQANDKPIGATHLVHFGGKPVRCIKKAWKATLERAGITRKIWPYDLRHAFATQALAADVDAGTVAKLMGHASTAMIFAHYQHVSNEQKRRAVERLPEMPYVYENMCPTKKGLLLEQ